MVTLTCDDCNEPAAFEMTRTTYVRDLRDNDADALTETYHACEDHIDGAVPSGLSARFSEEGKAARSEPKPKKKK